MHFNLPSKKMDTRIIKRETRCDETKYVVLDLKLNTSLITYLKSNLKVTSLKLHILLLGDSCASTQI